MAAYFVTSHFTPEPTNVVHEDVEEMLSDDSTAPEGHNKEHADPSEVEPMAEQHEPQAYGDSDDPSVDSEADHDGKTGGA